MLIGIRISLAIGFVAVFISLIIGITMGAIAGYYGGKVDAVIMWLINVTWSIPTLLLVIAITLALGKGFWQVFIAVGLTMWVEVARVVRGQVMGVKKMQYVNAARALGFNDFRIITKQEKIKYDYFLNVLYKDVNLVGKVDGIVFSHVLEHLPPHLSLAVLDNLRGFLKKDGILRISVPSLDAYENAIVPPDQNITTPILAKNSLFYRWNHKFMYNQELLTVLLESVGFSNVRITDCGLDELGEFDVKRRRDETLYLICTAK
jgi:predicted SAM-dependent methyltransferase